MKSPINPIRYGIYVRKSSDSEDRQVQSLVRQKNDLMRVIEREELEIVHDPFEESQTAFKVGRPVFEQLVQRTMDGEINGWVCWHTNRLSRNPIDSGMVIHLMDLGYLKEIRTFSGVYTNSPSHKLMLQFEFGISKNDSEEKSAIVKSGMRRRYERGYPSGHPPVGFKLASDQPGKHGKSFWVADYPRFQLVKKVFHRFLEGRDSISTITSYAELIGLRALDRPRVKGGYLQKSSIHRMLRNPVYAGMFKGPEDQIYPLEKSLPRIITNDEFKRIGQILGERNLCKFPHKRDFAFSGLIRCPVGETLGVDPKFHLVCDCQKKFSYPNRTTCPYCGATIAHLRRPRYRTYTYYYSKRSRRGVGRRIRAIEEKKVRALLIEHIEKEICLPKELLQWSLKYLKELQDDVLRIQRNESRRRAQILRDIEEKKRRLLDLRIDGTISKADYDDKIKEFEAIEAESDRSDYTLPKDWKDEAQKIGCLAEETISLLRHGEAAEINEAISGLGITLMWDGEVLSFKHSPTLEEVIQLFKRSSVAHRFKKIKSASQVEPIREGIENPVLATLPTRRQRLP